MSRQAVKGDDLLILLLYWMNIFLREQTDRQTETDRQIETDR